MKANENRSFTPRFYAKSLSARHETHSRSPAGHYDTEIRREPGHAASHSSVPCVTALMGHLPYKRDVRFESHGKEGTPPGLKTKHAQHEVRKSDIAPLNTAHNA